MSYKIDGKSIPQYFTKNTEGSVQTSGIVLDIVLDETNCIYNIQLNIEAIETVIDGIPSWDYAECQFDLTLFQHIGGAALGIDENYTLIVNGVSTGSTQGASRNEPFISKVNYDVNFGVITYVKIFYNRYVEERYTFSDNTTIMNLFVNVGNDPLLVRLSQVVIDAPNLIIKYNYNYTITKIG